MNKLILATFFCLAAGGANAAAADDYGDITTVLVKPGLYMLQGRGGNIGVSAGPEGVFVIDDKYAPLSGKVLSAIAAISPDPVAFVVNTHWHDDHTGGNRALRDAGAVIVAHRNVRERLKAALSGDGSGENALPSVTFSDEIDFYWNGADIRVWHPAGAHTDGDAIIEFSSLNVVHMGDVMFNGLYPFIDVDSGGDIDGYIAAQEAVYARIDDDTVLIPGHGPLARKSDLAAQIVMLRDVRARVLALIGKGLDEEAAVRADPLKDLDARWSWEFITGERMTRAAYRSLADAP